MQGRDALFSSDRVDWNTPEFILERVRAVNPIGLDPCSNANSTVRARVEWALPDHDGLKGSWNDFGLVFVNPPYARGVTRTWAEKCATDGDAVIALLPARTAEAWFRPVWTADALCFLDGRVRFVGGKYKATFPSVVAYWHRFPVRDPGVECFKKHFGALGTIVKPEGVSIRSLLAA